jgi:hypothetical protein
MIFAPTEEQLMVRDIVRKFAESGIIIIRRDR